MAQPLHATLKSDGLDLIEVEGKQSIGALKEELSEAPILGQPNYKLPFFPFTQENKGNALEILTQKHGERHSSLEYYSEQLDSVPNGLPRCLRATSAETRLCKQTFNHLCSSLFCQIFAKLSPLLNWLLTCFLHLILLLFNVTVLTQKLYYLLHRIETLTTSLFLEDIPGTGNSH